MPRKELSKAVAYFRTSSTTNVGPDKDSLKRQRSAVLTFAKSAGYDIAEEFYDAAVSGADAIDERPGFAAMLQRLLGNGVRTIIVETASRFARDLIVQETGWRFLRNAGVTLIAADSPDSFLDETPTAVLVRQVLGAVAQFEKQALVAKLRKARERKKHETGKCGGRHSVAEAKPETVEMAKKLARYPVNGRHRSLREVAAELQAAGHVTSKGTPYGAAAIARMMA
jgi:DNA invertase Pin-like site-specific DNA recombinase